MLTSLLQEAKLILICCVEKNHTFINVFCDLFENVSFFNIYIVQALFAHAYTKIDR